MQRELEQTVTDDLTEHRTRCVEFAIVAPEITGVVQQYPLVQRPEVYALLSQQAGDELAVVRDLPVATQVRVLLRSEL